MIARLRQSFLLALLMTVLLGGLYPAFVWSFGQLFFPEEANGNIVFFKGKIVGAEMIGQNFTQDSYFHGRPSATPERPYNFMSSGASNLNPANPVLIHQIESRARAVATPAVKRVPADLTTASASGLDPHISPEAAFIQVHRIATARNCSEHKIQLLINDHIEGRTLGFMGEPRVNVLRLNIELDRLTERPR